MEKRLYRSKENKIISGVCAGIAGYFNLDPAIVRILWVLVSLVYGVGIIVYIVAAIILPDKEENTNCYNAEVNNVVHEDVKTSCGNSDNIKTKGEYNSAKTKNIIGGGLILLGLMFLLREFLHWIDFKIILSVFFIITGIVIIIKGRRRSY